MENEWEMTILGEIVSTNDSIYSPRENWLFINYLDTSNITENKIDEIQHLIQGKDKIPDRARRKILNGDIVFSTVRPNQKHYGILTNPPPNLLVSTGFTTIRANEQYADTNFIYWYLTQPIITEILQSIGENTASAYPSIKPSDIEKLEILLPPIPEQKAIAHILGSLDDKIELNRQMNETLEKMAQALFKSWFVDFDPVIDNTLEVGNPIPEEFSERAEVRGKALAYGTANREVAKQFPDAFQFTKEMGWIPEGWEVTDFGEVSLCFDRKRIPLSKKQREDKKPGIIPYYGATSIMDFINEWIFDDTYLLIGEDGSVIKEDGSPFIQYIWGKSWVNNHAHILQGTSGISTEHLMLFMKSQDIKAFVTGAVQLKINQKNMNSIPFLKAGDKINRQFTDCINPVYEKIKMLTEKNESLIKIRDTLLPKLISGEIRIPDSDNIIEVAG